MGAAEISLIVVALLTADLLHASLWSLQTSYPTGSAMQTSFTINSTVYFLPDNRIVDIDKDERVIDHLYMTKDIASFEFEIVPLHGEAPIVRDQYCAVPIENKVFLFGGIGESYMNDLSILDLQTRAWTQVSPPKSPSSRRYPMCFEWKGEFYVYGGLRPVDVARDLWVLKHDQSDSSSPYTWQNIILRAPSMPYLFAGITTFYKDSLFIYGGRDVGEVMSLKAWQLNMTTLTWSGKFFDEISPTSATPTYLGSGHRIGNILYIHPGFEGSEESRPLPGIFAFDLDLWTIECISDCMIRAQDYQFQLETPLPRARSSMTGFQNYLILSGGQFTSQLDDIWIFNTQTKEWVGSSQQHYPIGRYRPAIALSSPSSFVIFGGDVEAEDGIPLNDLWEFNSQTKKWTLLYQRTKPSSNTKAVVPDPVLMPILCTWGENIYIFGGLGDEFSASTSFVFNRVTSLWSVFNLPSDAQFMASRYGMAYLCLSDKLYVWGGLDTTKSQETQSTYAILSLPAFAVDDIRTIDIPPMSGASAFMHQDRFCIYGGSDDDEKSSSFITCMANGQASQLFSVNLNKEGSPASRFFYYGVGLILGGISKNQPYSSSVTLVNLETKFSSSWEAPPLRPAPLMYATAVDIGGVLYVTGSRMEDWFESRVWSYDVGKTFCGPAESVINAGTGIVITDGSEEFGYLPSSDCSWILEGANVMEIEHVDINAKQSLLSIATMGTCGDVNIYIPKNPPQPQGVLLPQNTNQTVSVPSAFFEINFKATLSHQIQDGFRIFATYCPEGYILRNRLCTCLENHYITPSGDCAACPAGHIQPSINQFACESLLPSESGNESKDLTTSVQTEWTEHQTSLPNCHLALSVTFDDALYVFCGLDSSHGSGSTTKQIQTFKVQESASVRWTLLSIFGKPPPLRRGACVVRFADDIIYIGGKADSQAPNNTFSFDTKTATWLQKGPSPLNYEGHLCVSDGKDIYIHGGISITGEIFDTTYKYNIANDAWQLIATQNSPRLAYHSGWSFDSTIYAYGGFDGNQELDLLYALNPRTAQWIAENPLVNSCIECQETSNCRLARDRMATVVVEGSAYVFGGTQSGSLLRDMLVFDIERKEIVEIRDFASGSKSILEAPPPSHSAVLGALNKKLVFFAGEGLSPEITSNSVWIYSTESSIFLSSTTVDAPLGRVRHAAAQVDDKRWIVFGGQSSDIAETLTSDLWMFDTGLRQWKRLSQHSTDTAFPPARVDAIISVWKGAVYILGGRLLSGGADRQIWKGILPNLDTERSLLTTTWASVLPNLTDSEAAQILYRYGHAAVSRENLLWVWGGQRISVQALSEDYASFYVYDHDRNVLKRETASSRSPIARVYHGMVSIASRICIYGGRDLKGRPRGDLWCFEIETSLWTMEHPGDGAVFKRSNMAIAGYAQGIIVSGGYGSISERRDDVMLFNTQHKTWTPMYSPNLNGAPFAIAGHLGFLVVDTLFIFGGSSEAGIINRVYAVKPSLCGQLPVELFGARQPALLSQGDKDGGYPRGSTCTWILKATTHMLIKTDLSEGDSLVAKKLEGATYTDISSMTMAQNNTISLSEAVDIVVVFTSQSTWADWSDKQGFSITYATCPEKSVFTESGCSCPQGLFEDEAGKRCLECKSGSYGVECDTSTDSSAVVTTIAVVISAFVGISVAFIAYYFRRRQTIVRLLEREKKAAMHISYSEIEFGSLLGKGAFGKVFAGKWRECDVAVKVLHSSYMKKEVLDEFTREVAVMIELRHPNVVLYMAVCVEPPNLCIVSELMKRGTLYDALHDYTLDLTLSTKLGFILDAARGMSFLHLSNPPILHRDLKSPNLLLDEKWHLKISDFGLTGIKQDATKNEAPVGSLLWMAPEVARKEQYTEACDVYSYAIIMWEVFTRKVPYEGDEAAEAVILRVAHDGYRPALPQPDVMSDELQDLMIKCWDQKAEARPTFDQISKELSGMLQALKNTTDGDDTPSTGISVHGSRMALVSLDLFDALSLWSRFPAAMEFAAMQHNEVIIGIMKRNGGAILKAEGDDLLIGFKTPKSALLFCLQCQEMLLAADWDEKIMQHPSACVEMDGPQILFRGLRVRMALNYGSPNFQEDPITGHLHYFGSMINHTVLVKNSTTGGQIIGTESFHQEIYNIVEDCGSPILRDIGFCGVSGISDPIHLFEFTPSTLASRIKRFIALGYKGSGSNAETNHLIPSGTTSEKEASWQLDYLDLNVTEFELGSGSFGVVHLGVYCNEKVAVKRFLRQKLADQQYFSLLSEILILKDLHHPSILKFYGACVKQPNICVVTEYAAHGSLREILLNKKIEIDLKGQIAIMKQIADGMAYLHAKKPAIYHRDLKSPNILMTSIQPMQAKITDFGFARVKADNQTMTKCGSRAWLAPEIYLGIRYNEKADVYSYGIMFWEVLAREKPFTNMEPVTLGTKIIEGARPRMPSSAHPSLAKLAVYCWQGDPEFRPSFQEASDALAAIATENGVSL